MRIDSSGNLDMTNGGGNIIMANGAGIDFSASEGGGASSSILDDYEEGTFTPTISGTSGGSGTISGLGGRYTKIGNTVRVDIEFKIDNTGTISGNLTASLPFVASDEHAGCGREGQNTGDTVQVNTNSGTATLFFVRYNNTSMVVTNNRITSTTIYQTSA